MDFQGRAKALVARMTAEEKAQMLRFQSPAIPRLQIPAYNWWNEGLHGIARTGTATVFPQAIGLAATFDRQLLHDAADVTSTEARAKYNAERALDDRDIYKGITLWSPNVNIFRDPRWGRGQETYGEDPYLSAELGVQFVNGLQGDGEYLKTAACAKHFAVHSGPESLRHEFNVSVSAKDLNETYLPAFKALVQEGHVEAIMGAYNRVDGLPCCGNAHLLTEILRDTWGFQGHVVSDCWAILDFHEHHKVTATAPESAAMAIKAGCDLNCGSVYYLSLLEALSEGLISEDDLTRAAERVMETRFKLGMMDDDCLYDQIPFSACDTDEHAALALKAVEESMVLLKNDGLLPLHADKIRTIAVIGPNADSVRCLQGNYCGISSRFVTFLEGIRAYAAARGIRVLYSEGCHLFRDRVDTLAQPGDRMSEARACAMNADVIIACLGLDAGIEGEQGDTSNDFPGGDRETLDLLPPQKKLLDMLASLHKPLITVVAQGSAVPVTQGNAILQAFYPGQAGGTALANILFGEVSPSGRLPFTVYQKEEDLPPFTDYAMKGRTYRYFEGVPAYPFGFGLSYTTFAYENLTWEKDALHVTVRNTGNMDADDTVLAYVKRDSEFDPVNPSLCAFERVHLKAGEATSVRLALKEGAYQVIDDQGHPRSVAGCTFHVGGMQVRARL